MGLGSSQFCLMILCSFISRDILPKNKTQDIPDGLHFVSHSLLPHTFSQEPLVTVGNTVVDDLGPIPLRGHYEEKSRKCALRQ